MFPPQGSFVPPASWRSQRSAAPEARSSKQKLSFLFLLFVFQTITSCHVHRRQEHNGLTGMSQQLNLQGHLICIKPYLWPVSVFFVHSLGCLEVSPFRARQKFKGHLLKAAHCFQVESCARFHRLRNFGGFRMLLDGFPCVCTHWKKKKSSFLPASSWFLGSAVGLQPIWHQVKASRWESLSLVLWVSGSWPVERLAPGERQSRWSQWAQVVPVQTRVHQVRGVSVAQQVLSPAPRPSVFLLT